MYDQQQAKSKQSKNFNYKARNIYSVSTMLCLKNIINKCLYIGTTGFRRLKRNIPEWM
jgi:hypothetical protein